MTVRDADPKPLAAPAPAVGPRHLGRGPGLVDEDEPLRIKIELAVEPDLPAPQDIRALLFRGMGRLFLRMIACRLKKRCSEPKRTGPCASGNDNFQEIWD